MVYLLFTLYIVAEPTEVSVDFFTAYFFTAVCWLKATQLKKQSSIGLICINLLMGGLVINNKFKINKNYFNKTIFYLKTY